MTLTSSALALSSLRCRPPGSLRPDIVVIGGSAGGFGPLKALLAGLPADLSAALFVVIHIPETRPSALSRIAGLAGPLVSVSVDGRGEAIEYGRVYVAAPGRHLTVTRRRVRNGHGPKLGHHRPSVDVLFRSAAAAFGPRVIGVVLSGYLRDGSEGLGDIRRCGGTTIVQDPHEAECGEMPRHAIRVSSPDYCVPSGELAPLVRHLTGRMQWRSCTS